MTANKTYPVLIARDTSGNVLIKSVTTGNRLAVALNKLSDGDRDWIDGLLPFGADAKKIDLEIADMRRFKALADAQAAPKATPVAKPAVVPAPTVKPETNGTSDHADAATLSVIGKSRALNGYDATLPTEAQGLGKATKLAEAIASGLWQFTYDIRSDLADLAKKNNDPWLRCPNPSQRCRIGGKARGKGWDFKGMWHFAARDQGSAWLLTGKTASSPELAKLIAHWENVNQRIGLNKDGVPAVRVRKLRVHESEVERLYSEAKLNIAREIERCRVALKDQLATADKALADLVAEPTTDAKAQDKAQRQHDSRWRGVLVQSAAAYYAAKDSAELFDATQDVAHLLDGLKNAVKAAKDFFNARADRTGKPSNVTV